jgi:hypothetical protein
MRVRLRGKRGVGRCIVEVGGWVSWVGEGDGLNKVWEVIDLSLITSMVRVVLVHISGC